MANVRAIRTHIRSVESTRKITKSMKMVAAAKIKRASDRMERALPWSGALADMLVSTAKYAQVDSEPLLQKHEVPKRSVIIVVTSDRGLAGGFNTNVLRAAEKLMPDVFVGGAEGARRRSRADGAKHHADRLGVLPVCAALVDRDGVAGTVDAQKKGVAAFALGVARLVGGGIKREILWVDRVGSGAFGLFRRIGKLRIKRLEAQRMRLRAEQQKEQKYGNKNAS